MNMSNEVLNTENPLTIVIPAKNEAKLIPNLLNSLTKQDYPQMPLTRVLVADAGSTDGTAEIVMTFRESLAGGSDFRWFAVGGKERRRPHWPLRLTSFFSMQISSRPILHS